MRRWMGGIIFIGICLIMAALAAWVYVGRHGPRIIEARLGALTGREVKVRAVYPTLPLGVLVEDLSIGGLLRIEHVLMAVNPLALCRGELKWQSVTLDHAVLLWAAPVDNAPALAGISSSSSQALKSGSALSSASRFQTSLDRLVVNNAEFFLRLPDGGNIHFSRINANVSNLPLDGGSARSGVVLSASLGNVDLPFVGNFVSMRGWFDWASRDMQMFVKATDDNGHVGARISLRSVHNDCVVLGRLRFQKDQQSQALGKNTGRLEDLVLGVLEATESDVGLRFVFRTPLDRFKVGKVYLTGQITSSLNSADSSGNIVQSLKAVAAQLLPQEDSSGSL